jgi:hypothetical protein
LRRRDIGVFVDARVFVNARVFVDAWVFAGDAGFIDSGAISN